MNSISQESQTTSYLFMCVVGLDKRKETLFERRLSFRFGKPFSVLLFLQVKLSVNSFSNNGAGVCGSVVGDDDAHVQQNVSGPSVMSYELVSSDKSFVKT